MGDAIDRQAAIAEFSCCELTPDGGIDVNYAIDFLKQMPSAQQEDYTDLKREFIRMASYIDVLLECSDVQKETLLGFISRLAEFMPWTERD